MKRKNITDRAHRYRANSPEHRPLGPKVCAVKLPNGRICRSRRNVVPHHVDGNPSNTKRGNLIWACKSCNTREGKRMAKLGIGRRTRQYNPGAGNLAQYVQAAVEHTRGAHDAGGKIIHETPKGKRKAFAREIAFRKGHRNPAHPYPRSLTIAGFRVEESYPGRFKVFTPGGMSPTLTSKKKVQEWITKYGKNPTKRNAFEERISAGSRVAVISGNERTGPFWTRVYVNGGETATLTVKKAKTIEGARKQAREMLSKYGQNPMHIVGTKKPGDDRKLIKGAMKLIRATGYHALARQFAEEPDKRERIARTVGGIIEKKHGAARGAQAVELLMAAVNRLKQNPGAGAEELYRSFHGRGPDKSYDIMVPVTDPYTAHPEIAQLGKLLSLTVGEAVKMTGPLGTIPKGTDSEIEGWAEEITFKVKAPDVAAEPGGKQIYIAGGDQNLDSLLEQLGADPTKELLDLGFCYRIEYMTQKKFDQFRPTDYWHLFGEETGVQPRLIYDRRNKLIQLVGGEYVIRPEGIVN